MCSFLVCNVHAFAIIHVCSFDGNLFHTHLSLQRRAHYDEFAAVRAAMRRGASADEDEDEDDKSSAQPAAAHP